MNKSGRGACPRCCLDWTSGGKPLLLTCSLPDLFYNPVAMQKLLPVILLVLVSTSSVVAKDWHGILPLHSTRADVEALLGPPLPPPADRAYTLNKAQSIYFLDEGEVYIIFADNETLPRGNCNSVANGTVLWIRITPKDTLLLSSLNLDEKAFRKIHAPDPVIQGYEGFIDDKEGLAIRAFKGAVEEMVYLPNAPDRERCSSYYENLEDFVKTAPITCGLHFDAYGNIDWDDEKARLDNFAIQLINEEKAQGYIIVYAGRKAYIGEAQLRANRARDYLIKVREVDPERVKAFDGGHQEDFTVNLYIAPEGAPPPDLNPTVDPSQVEVIYEKKRRSPKKPN